MAKKKYICTGCNKCTEPCTVELSGDTDMTKDPAKMLHCGTWVEVPAEENTNKEQLPKLTTEVFSMEECPEWAQYAAVDANGTAYWYAMKPELNTCTWGNTGAYFKQLVREDKELRYDASDWKNSLIERPAEERLPTLTAEVFSFRDCPNWAHYAAVDAEGVAYWYAAKPKLDPQAWCNVSENFHAKQITLANIPIRYDRANWRNSLIERPAEEQPAKLTQDVFSMSECPEWAQYAAVDSDGVAYWYEDKPEIATYSWSSTGILFTKIAREDKELRYDASDWKNSLIERLVENQLPKLTLKVFATNECPEWAQYVAVDSDGVAYWYADKPELNRSLGGWNNTGEHNVQRLTLYYDSTDWDHSLIEHPDTNRPELTQTVFILSDTPAWAQYAAVDAYGTAHWFSAEPMKPAASSHIWRANGCSCRAILPGAFAARNWRNSCIRRNHTVKLTEEIFDHPECPADAVVAVVSDDGTAAWGNRADITLSGNGSFKAAGYSDYNTWTPIPGGACFDTTDWQHSAVYRAGTQQCTEYGLLALTHDVFSYSTLNEWKYVTSNYVERGRTYTGCPEWARYAAVNEDGAAYVYEFAPVPLGEAWTVSCGRYAIVCDADKHELKFDATNWRGSLIVRQPEAPRQKLTTDVFSMPECPAWAKYAAVDANGLTYWYDAVPKLGGGAVKYRWENNGQHALKVYYTDNPETPLFDATDWDHSLIERPAAAPLPKFTDEVFSMPECPDWACYAAVDSDGVAYWYDAKPELKSVCGGWLLAAEDGSQARQIRARYDFTDWEHSLVRRLRKLTEKIFDHPECPADAVAAVVNADGTAVWGTCADIEPYGGGFRTKEPTLGCWTRIPGECFDATDWEHSAVYKTDVQPKSTEPKVLKLRPDTFSYSTTHKWKYTVCSHEDRFKAYTGCPEWARYAAVDKNGIACVYENKPIPLHTVWTNDGGRYAVARNAENDELKFDASDWRNSLVERPKSDKLPKLTQDVFSLPKCPEWAKYAAVDEDGIACYYTDKPSIRGGRWEPVIYGKVQTLYDEHYQYIRYDTTDWKHSLIERLAVVPKLTHDVFSMEECPKWAQYAAVDENGFAYWYETQPKLCTARCWLRDRLRSKKMTHPGSDAAILFDATDWAFSLIERKSETQRQKLTTDVFAMEECPEWAQYAAVDADGDAYWYDTKPPLREATWSSIGADHVKQITHGNTKLRYDSSDWEHSLIERPAVAPKLTHGVFSYSNLNEWTYVIRSQVEHGKTYTRCPEWARYAAVDQSGAVCVYDTKPVLRRTDWYPDSGGRCAVVCNEDKWALRFDTIEWRNSLIERPAVVPDWFKPGVLAYNNDTHSFFHVTDSTEYCENYLEAKVRPFSDDELESLLGQFVCGPKNSKLLVTGFRPKGDISGKPEICVLCGWLTAEELLTRQQGIKQYHSTEGTWIDCGLSS